MLSLLFLDILFETVIILLFLIMEGYFGFKEFPNQRLV